MAIRVDPEAVRRSAEHVDKVNDQMGAIMRSLKTRCEGAQGNFFDGGAAVQFQQLMERYNGATLKCHQALRDIAEGIRQNGKGYDAAEQTVLETVNAVQNATGLDIPTIIPGR